MEQELEDPRVERLVAERTQQLARANDELRRTNDVLRTLAVRDGLTGLFNHRSLLEQLSLEVARAERYGRQFGLVFVDIDGFRRINDRFGHAVGDEVLVATARLLHGQGAPVRRSDFAARYGADELCLLLPETGPEGVLVEAERIRNAVAEKDWGAIVPGMSEAVTVSLGAATYPLSGITPLELVEAAGHALSSAKRGGRNRVCAAEPRAAPPTGTP